MKKSITFLFFLCFLIVSSSHGDIILTVIPTACTLQQEQVGSEYDETCNQDVELYMAGAFDVGASGYTATKITLKMYRVGSPNGNLYAAIWTDGGSGPGSQVAASTTSYVANAISTSSTEYDFLFAGASLSASTTYYVGYYNDYGSGAYDGSNYLVFVLDTDPSGDVYRDADGVGSWGLHFPTTSSYNKIYSGSCL
jgi:hypothetical protein